MRKILVILMLLMFTSVVYSQYNSQPQFEIPKMVPNSFIQDHAGVLNDLDKKEIDLALREFKRKYNLEYGMVIVPSTNDRPITEYSLRIAREYGIGSKDNEKRGLLLLIAVKDRTYRFEISRHMEEFLTDSQSSSIARNILIQKLKTATSQNTSLAWKDALMSTMQETDKVIARNIQPEHKSTPAVVSDDDDVVMCWGTAAFIAAMFTIIGLGWALIRREDPGNNNGWTSSPNKKEFYPNKTTVIRQKLEETRKTKEENEKRRQEWLKTPAGMVFAKYEADKAANENKLRIEKETKEKEERERQAEVYANWLKSPAGLEYTRKEEQKRKDNEERERERIRKQREAEEQREQQRREEERLNAIVVFSPVETSSTSSSDDSSYSSSNNDSSSSISDSFGGGGDFSGGGSDGSF